MRHKMQRCQEFKNGKECNNGSLYCPSLVFMLFSYNTYLPTFFLFFSPAFSTLLFASVSFSSSSSVQRPLYLFEFVVR